MIVAYKIVASSDFAKLDAHVGLLISHGWQPYGPPFIRPEHVDGSGGVPAKVAHQLVQAMVQYALEESDDD